MAHRYPTRFQENRIKMIQARQANDHLNRLNDNVTDAVSYEERLKKLICLYQYVYETPILIEKMEGFREDVWDKLNILEELLLEKLQTLCYGTSTDEARNAYDGRVHELICHAMFLIEDIRTKYWQ